MDRTPARSAMVDGEVALMLGLRRMVAERAEYQEPMRERLEITQRRMERSPVLCAESYPDECWLFCNSVTLAAMRLEDVLDHTNHGAFFQRWLAARERGCGSRPPGCLSRPGMWMAVPPRRGRVRKDRPRG